MIVRIKKELRDTIVIDGYAMAPRPLYHIYKVDDEGKEEFMETVEGDIKLAARKAETLIDLNALEVAYKEKGPDAFSSISISKLTPGAKNDLEGQFGEVY